MKLRTIITLTICFIITFIFAIYNFLLVPIFMYGMATVGFIITLNNKGVKLGYKEFLDKYSWPYLVVSIFLILFAVVNSIGINNAVKEYEKCYQTEINDTVVALDDWGKTGNKIRLATGESYCVFIGPLTEVIEVEGIIKKNKNIITLHKKAHNDTLTFVDSYDYKWYFEIGDPTLKTIFEK